MRAKADHPAMMKTFPVPHFGQIFLVGHTEKDDFLSAGKILDNPGDAPSHPGEFHLGQGSRVHMKDRGRFHGSQSPALPQGSAGVDREYHLPSTIVQATTFKVWGR